MNLRFTRYKQAYFEESAQLMSQTWHFNEGFENPRDESLVFKAYFEHSLLESSYTDFLVDDNDRVLGYLLASTPHHDNLLQRMKVGCRYAKAMLNLSWHFAMGDFGNRQKAWEMFEVQNELDEEIYKDTDSFDSELVLFFLSDELRGQGYGRKLTERYYAFCRQQNIKNIFLFTDLACNVGFYDNNGFKRHRQFHHPYLAKPEQQYNGFIYTRAITA
ncbi:hypothetical protein GZ77_23455 [Endozoicomonas montiporae]|uniref:N-acetyltransferase domain-containing protein n=2 Tax=Endozoicomonas montiporae TaxID=1027273 RepID=A0A081N0R7_9GAMM|nr:GNAT family N-acetyltransferase [Endozoicomonas montiporae]AMO54521.1 hypothetical protein EZMO1_0256 [Endozoicomonas montiporae CL-33]KEQ12040.1 hypothetical protein GZ77_23455 [Endozoicomonas montiporae]